MNNRVAGAKRSKKMRVLGALGIGSIGLLGGAAIAGAATTGLVFTLTAATQGGVTSDLLKWIAPLVSTTTLATAGGSTATKPATTTIATPGVVAAAATATPAVKPMAMGINIANVTYWGGERVFSNLVAGSVWQLVDSTYKWSTLPADRQDASYSVTRIDGADSVYRALSIPTKAYSGASVDIICRWKGTVGSAGMFGKPARNVKVSKNSLTFTFIANNRENPYITFKNVGSADPLREVDCREVDADPKALFDPRAIEDLKRFNTIRFLDWSAGVNNNIKSVTWATRMKPNLSLYAGPDSVPIEYMVALANQTQTNPWFTIPYNASEDYVRGMATYVRDNLDPKLKAHIELSNEVWNWVFPVTTQASTEGKAAKLSSNEGLSMLYRYVQRVGETMDIWSSVYSGQMSRIVRIAAFQNANSWGTDLALRFNNAAVTKKIDAVATAPYFGYKLAVTDGSTPAQLDAFFNTKVEKDIEDTIANAKKNKAFAEQHGLRFITYEAGQHYVLDSDVTISEKVQRDPRMGKAYTKYLTRWKNEVGDLMTLYSTVTPINKYGAWGLQEYVTQPLNQAPKANAVELFRKSYVAK